MLNIDLLKKHLLTNLFGTNLIYFPEVASTNAYLQQLARDGSPEGSVVVTGFQQKGKGRQQRRWYAKAGENMLLSILLRPELDIETVQKITLAAANILIDSIQTFLDEKGLSRLEIAVKWPNDLLVGKRKLAGILAESTIRGKEVDALVLGFGVNVNTPVREMPDEVRELATSLYEACGKKFVLEEFIAHFLNTFERYYFWLVRHNYSGVVDEWKKYCNQFGKAIKIHINGRVLEGYFEDISTTGHLLYRLQSGEIGTLIAGDVTT